MQYQTCLVSIYQTIETLTFQKLFRNRYVTKFEKTRSLSVGEENSFQNDPKLVSRLIFIVFPIFMKISYAIVYRMFENSSVANYVAYISSLENEEKWKFISKLTTNFCASRVILNSAFGEVVSGDLMSNRHFFFNRRNFSEVYRKSDT